MSSILVPLSASDFTPFAQQAAAAKPDLLFVAWAGDTAAAMWRALQQQGVFKTTTSRRVSPSAAPGSLRCAAGDIKFLVALHRSAPHNKVNDWLVKQMNGSADRCPTSSRRTGSSRAR